MLAADEILRPCAIKSGLAKYLISGEDIAQTTKYKLKINATIFWLIGSFLTKENNFITIKS